MKWVQRGWKRQPEGGLTRLGGSPGGTSRKTRAFSGSGSAMGAQERARVGMERIAQDVVHECLFDDFAGVHDEDAFGEVAHGGEVVGDVDDGQIV